ncbi:MAG: PspC domain-containing protein [Hungatella sp.]|jgi:phage shock protein PspC (stress-responsive transcriptional regulator)|nr:PspC domain-containing protein [Hungatella sp.]
MDLGKKLYKSSVNRMLCGVCGGIGEYLNVDSTLIRLVWAIFACTGTGILAYFIAAIIIPSDTCQ